MATPTRSTSKPSESGRPPSIQESFGGSGADRGAGPDHALAKREDEGPMPGCVRRTRTMAWRVLKLILAVALCTPAILMPTSRSNAQDARDPGALTQLYANGPLVNAPGGGAGGADGSRVQTSLGLGFFGFGAQLALGN